MLVELYASYIVMEINILLMHIDYNARREKDEKKHSNSWWRYWWHHGC